MEELGGIFDIRIRSKKINRITKDGMMSDE